MTHLFVLNPRWKLSGRSPHPFKSRDQVFPRGCGPLLALPMMCVYPALFLPLCGQTNSHLSLIPLNSFSLPCHQRMAIVFFLIILLREMKCLFLSSPYGSVEQSFFQLIRFRAVGCKVTSLPLTLALPHEPFLLSRIPLWKEMRSLLIL